MDFANNIRIKRYSEKYLLGYLCVDGADRRVKMAHTIDRSHIYRRSGETKEQAIIAKELTGWRMADG